MVLLKPPGLLRCREASHFIQKSMDENGGTPLLNGCTVAEACNSEIMKGSMYEIVKGSMWNHGVEKGEDGLGFEESRLLPSVRLNGDILTERESFRDGCDSVSSHGIENGEDGVALNESCLLKPEKHEFGPRNFMSKVENGEDGVGLDESCLLNPEKHAFRPRSFMSEVENVEDGVALDESCLLKPERHAFRPRSFMSKVENGEDGVSLDESCLLKPEKHAFRPRIFISKVENGEIASEESLLSTSEKHDRPLTCFKVVRGVLSLLILLSTAFVTLLFLAPISSLLLRFISVHHSRKATSFIFGCWLAMWPFFFEKVNQTKVVFSGDKVPNGERVIVLCNHLTEVDWMYIWNLALRKGRIGYIKYVVKSSVRNAPIFGWALHVLEFLLIDRNWKVDEPAFESLLSTFKDPRDPLWLVLFPEGTDFTEEKCHRSQKYAEEHGLPKLKHVLLPRTKGFYACLLHLRESVTAVYDLTVGYKYKNPLFMDNACGTGPLEVHIHIKRKAILDIPDSEADISDWLIEDFCEKDDLLSTFYDKGSFPNSGIETELSTLLGIFNVCIILACNGLLLSLILFFSYWIKVYIALSCVYLAAATYFNYKPTPIVQCLRSG